MREESKNEGRKWDDGTFNGGMQDKNISAGQDLLISTDSKIDGGLRDEKQKITHSRD